MSVKELHVRSVQPEVAPRGTGTTLPSNSRWLGGLYLAECKRSANVRSELVSNCTRSSCLVARLLRT
jgi:hypothetical protein